MYRYLHNSEKTAFNYPNWRNNPKKQKDIPWQPWTYTLQIRCGEELSDGWSHWLPASASARLPPRRYFLAGELGPGTEAGLVQGDSGLQEMASGEDPASTLLNALCNCTAA